MQSKLLPKPQNPSLFIWRLINVLSFASILCSSRQYALNLVARLKFVILVLHLAPEIGGD